MTQTRLEAFYAKAGPWRAELAALRAILSSTALSETFKWRAPCYTCEAGNVLTVWRMKNSAAIGFFKGALLDDPHGLLIAPGAHSRSMRALHFTSVAEIAAAAPAIRELIVQAVANEQAGRKVAFAEDGLEMPEQLRERLDGDPELRAAFEALTPGRQRGYLLHLARAKQAQTRYARIDRLRPRILAGKGLTER